MSNVKHFGARGDGVRDDRAAILHALVDGDGLVEFPRGEYRINEPIEIDLSMRGPVCVRGMGGTARIVMAGPGPAIRYVGHHGGTAQPVSLKPEIWQRERAPQLSALEIRGDHAEADGVELLGTMQPVLDRLLITQVRHGIVLLDRNRNVIVSACHIYHNSGYGIWFDRCNLHQTIVTASHISYNRLGGIRSSGGDLHNLQIVGNDIEYNYGDAPGAADIWFESLSDKASEITILGNTIQAVPTPGGANVRIVGHAETLSSAATLITITGNVLGSQETNLDLAHASRIVISGNTLYDGKLLTIRARDCRHLAITGNTFGWNATTDREMNGGIELVRCELATITGCTLEDDRTGSEKSGGAISLVECLDSSVSNCQIIDPRWCGISVVGSRRVRLTDNTIYDRREPRQMIAAIRIEDGGHNLIQGNLVGPGRDATVICQPNHGTVQGNIDVV